ncbi:hypothetical protein NMY22_g14498 [Coprinellus aureogranulatus]|nr:hypothetical protein NMY22_g14498 [Coprinellus aureogranulatus]
MSQFTESSALKVQSGTMKLHSRQRSTPYPTKRTSGNQPSVADENVDPLGCRRANGASSSAPTNGLANPPRLPSHSPAPSFHGSKSPNVGSSDEGGEPAAVCGGLGARSIKDKVSLLETHIRDLETSVAGFKEKVEVIATEFEALQGELDDCVLSIEALEADHRMALDAVEEERHTAAAYYDLLQDSQVEIRELVRRFAPQDCEDYPISFAQAK